MILCKDCKWNDGCYCRHEKSLVYIDPVIGKKHYKWCDVMRIFKECGEDAKYFEPNLFYKIKRMLMLCRKS